MVVLVITVVKHGDADNGLRVVVMMEANVREASRCTPTSPAVYND